MTDIPCPYGNEDVPNTAANLLRYVISEGLRASAVSIDLCADRSTIGHWRVEMNSRIVIDSFDRAVLLLKLMKVDPDAAENAADWMVTAAEAGDSYGEWLWQWADEIGLDPDAICADARAPLPTQETTQ